MNENIQAAATAPRRSRLLLTFAVLASTALMLLGVSMAMASPPAGVSATVLARGSFDEFKAMSDPANGGLFKAEAKSDIDVVVRRHAYTPGGSTGWHAHPYPVLITVIEGHLTFYAYDDPTCTPTVVGPGEGYVDDGRGHIARNETGVPATDVSVILAPVGAPFRSELDAPGPHCGF